MNTIRVPKHKISRMLVNVLSMLVILATALPVTAVASAARDSPFVGKWQAVDVDGSDMSLAIGGRSTGPFRITWTDEYISFCDGKAGIVRGTGWLNEENPDLLEADVTLECFTTDETLDFHVTLRYHAVTNTLSIHYFFGQVTIWHRPGGGPEQGPATLDLRVNYGHDWVESFYEGGHTVWVTVTDGEGNLKATAELLTEPKDFWGGETGFQTFNGAWFDADGNQMEYAPDIAPNDWVYGWVDNGASAQVQIGEINGEIDLNADSIAGTVSAAWFLPQQVELECLPWGSPKPLDNVTYGMVVPDNVAEYSCSWSDAWNVLPYQDIGVGYLGPDGHWVANAFYASIPQIVASESGDWFWTTGFMPGPLDIAIFESADEGAGLLWDGQSEADASGFTLVGSDIHGQNLVEGNYLVISDGVSTKGIVLVPTAVTIFDAENDFMAGVAPAGSEVWAAAGPQDWQQRIFVEADPDTGEWMADFAAIGFDITEEMRGWSFSSLYDDDGDSNEGSTPMPHPASLIFAHPAYELVEGADWIPGTDVTLSIDDPANGAETDYSESQIVGDDSWLHFSLTGFDLEPGHIITMTDGQYTQMMVVSTLRVTGFNLDAQTVYGIANPNSEFFIADNGLPVAVDGNGNWSVTFDALIPGSWWTIIQRYGDGNEMRETFRAPIPMMIAWKNWDAVAGSEWTPGAQVTLTIDDPANGPGIDSVFTEFATDAGNLYFGNVYFELGMELQTGYVLTMSDGNFTKTLVLTSLMVTGFDFGAHIINGTGDPGTQLLVHLGGLESETAAVSDEHTWSVYHELLEPGAWFDAIQSDEDGDQTRDGGQAL